MKKLLLLLTAFLTLSFASPAVAFQQKAKHKKTATKDVTVYITRTGAKYHSDGCQYLRLSQISVSKREAINNGYTACSRCW